MTPCTIILERGLAARPGRDAAGRPCVEIARTPSGEEGPGLGHALALMTLGALAASVWWTAVILWLL